MIIPKRYVVRMLNIPEGLTRNQLENQFIQQKFVYKHLFFASNNGQSSAGFAFIEFETIEDMNTFVQYFEKYNEDILYNNGTM